MIGVSDALLAWRAPDAAGHDVLWTRTLGDSPGEPQPLAQAPPGGELGRPDVVEGRVLFHLAGSGGSRIVIADPADGTPQTLRRTPRAQVSNPSSDGRRLLHVHASGRQQELRLGPLEPHGEDEVIAVHPSSGRRDREHERGRRRHRHRYRAPLPPIAPRGETQSLWSTALAPDGAFVTRIVARRRTAAAGRHPARGTARQGVGAGLILRFGREGVLHMSRRTQLALLATTLVLAAPVGAQAKHHQPYKHVPNAVAEGAGGAAATVDSVATNAALEVLKRNGNAVDAAVAAAAVLGVTEPFSSGVGGGGFMVIRTKQGKVTTIDGREEAPAAMTPNAFIDPATGAPLTFAEGRYSGISAGVPGTVATWDKALRRYGSWSLKRVLQRGIDVAERGFVIDQTFYDQANDNLAYFDDITSSAALYLDPDGTIHDVGTVQRNPGMARTYERIAKRGASGFYRGPVAEAMAAAAQAPPLAAARRPRTGGPAC